MRKTFAGIILATIAALGLIGGLAFGLSDPVTTQPFNNIYVTRQGGATLTTATFAPTVSCRIETLYISFGTAPSTGTLTLTLDSGTSSSYDTLLYSVDISTVTAIVWPANGATYLLDDLDEIDILSTAITTSPTTTWGMQWHWSRP